MVAPTRSSILADIPKPKEEVKSSHELTQLDLDFKIHMVNFKMSQLSKNSNLDEEIFNFEMTDLTANADMKTFHLEGTFHLGGLSCTHLLLKTPKGVPVKMLSTKSNKNKLLSIEYVDARKNSPKLSSDHDNVLKKLDVQLAGVDIIVHQNAILDIIGKVNKFTDEVMSNTRNLIIDTPQRPDSVASGKKSSAEAPGTPR